MQAPRQDMVVPNEELDGAGWHTVVQQLFDHSPIAMCLVDLDGRFREVNPAMCRLLDRDAEELRRLTFAEVTHPDDLDADLSLLHELTSGRREAYRLQKRYLRPDGDVVWGDLSVCSVRDEYGAPRRFISQIVDITVDRALHAELARRSSCDALTGLANRDHTLVLLEDAVRDPSREGVLGVLYVDLDGFKGVNDALGHAAGDRLLTVLSERMVHAIGRAGFVGRMGGDEFVAVVEEAASPEEVEAVAESLRRALSNPVVVEGSLHDPTVSIGVALASPGTGDAEDLVREADVAMYQAKRAGRNRWHRHDPSSVDRAADGERLVGALGPGIADGEIRAWFQPILDLATGAVVGHEALARWRHPDRGTLRPAQFMPTAEDRGIAARIDAAVLDHACRLLARAAGDGAGRRPAGTFTSVNLSLGFLLQSGVADRVLGALDTHAVDPSSLVLEVTEAVALQLPRVARRDLEVLDGEGVRTFVDDFGTGYGALAVFDELPVSGVKLDRSLASAVGRGRTERVVEAMRSMADALGILGIVEGVETADELERFLAMGWRHGQGYLLGAPAPA